MEVRSYTYYRQQPESRAPIIFLQGSNHWLSSKGAFQPPQAHQSRFKLHAAAVLVYPISRRGESGGTTPTPFRNPVVRGVRASTLSISPSPSCRIPAHMSHTSHLLAGDRTKDRQISGARCCIGFTHVCCFRHPIILASYLILLNEDNPPAALTSCKESSPAFLAKQMLPHTCWR